MWICLNLKHQIKKDLAVSGAEIRWSTCQHWLIKQGLELQTPGTSVELANFRESEDRLRQQQLESTHREKVLVRRLATKEQEMQEYANQIAELKAAQAPGAAALRSALLDPAVNLLLQRLRQELLATRARLEETQNELSAWKFTPDSNTGKRLMAKCRLLYQENEELGRMINSGRLAKLEGDLALQKSFSEEVKKSQSELDEFLQDLDEDVEGMQSTIYYLQQELRKAKETVTSLQQENTLLKNGNTTTVSEHHEGVPDSEVGREARPRTPPICHNGVQHKGEEDLVGWEERTSNQAASRDPNISPAQSLPRSPSTPTAEQSVDIVSAHEEMTHSPPPPEEDSVSCEVRTRPRSPQEPEGRTFEESNESVNLQPPSPTTSATIKREWERTKHHDESSSDSGELILKLEAEDIGEEETESRDSNPAETESKVAKNRGTANVSDSEVETSIKSNNHTERSPVTSGPVLRKRTYPSDDSSGDDSDNVPLIKKVRRDSELSLHYNDEDDDETGLTNGDTSVVENDGQ
ncbi:pre-mRNA-splicing regulator WTAP isoform X2 [Periplaneta americana]|uniref:pre-mRNA-splicing regulator WTAP isoform X2 n=1 Tax=Periplaneta americana TaxID=6978 RepID=UPI0037E962C9